MSPDGCTHERKWNCRYPAQDSHNDDYNRDSAVFTESKRGEVADSIERQGMPAVVVRRNRWIPMWWVAGLARVQAITNRSASFGDFSYFDSGLAVSATSES